MTAAVERTFTIDLTPKDLARAFLEMDSHQQAEVLGSIGQWARDQWGDYKADCQWNMLAEALHQTHFTGGGRHFVAMLAACVEAYRPPVVKYKPATECGKCSDPSRYPNCMCGTIHAEGGLASDCHP